MKICKKCLLEKELSQFSKRRNGLNSNCKSCVKEYYQNHYLLNKDIYDKRNKEWDLNNKEYKQKLSQEYYQKNKERIDNRKKEYYKNEDNLNKLREQRRKYESYRRDTDPFYKLKKNLRRRILEVCKINNFNKNSQTPNILGCNYETIKNHLQNQFTNGMTWENQGEWHIDHIIPLSSATTQDELIKLCHYTNLQPLWAKDNLQKSNKIIKYEN